jgi:hypothetical protein
LTTSNRTLAAVRRHNKRQDKLKTKATVVLDAMRRQGQALHRHQAWYGNIWWLSRSGIHVPDEIARLVIANPAVVSDGDVLPLDCETLPQTFRIGGTSHD